jgi:hypothetical protein
MTERVVSEHRSRATGTTVAVIDNRDGSFDSSDENGWFTVCQDHGGVCSHPTRKLAADWAPVPDQWCPTCQEHQCATCGGTILDWSAEETCMLATCVRCGDERNVPFAEGDR